MRKSFFSFLYLGMFLVSCATPNQIPLPATPSLTQTPPPTQTIVWFPPSATATLQTIPTYTATAEMNPGIGALILADDFSDFTAWDTAESDLGSANVSRNRLTLVAQPQVYIASLRHDLAVGNFYAG